VPEQLFILNQVSTLSMVDETGDKSGYNYYSIKLNKNLKMLLKKISLKSENKNQIKTYDFLAIPNFNSCQEYFIKPMKINNNLDFMNEMRLLKDYSTNKERVNKYFFYNNENEKDIDSILETLGYQYFKNKLVLGYFTTEAGISSFKPLFKKKFIIPSRFRTILDEITLNSWRINILLTLPDSFKDEYGASYKGRNLGTPSFLFNSFIEKLIELHILYRKDNWVYDVYRLFNFNDDRNRLFIYEGLKLTDINEESLKQLLNKVKIDLQIRKEEFSRFYSDLLNWYISQRYEELLKNEETLKPILLKFLGIDYK
jgi:hypothetical protein